MSAVSLKQTTPEHREGYHIVLCQHANSMTCVRPVSSLYLLSELDQRKYHVMLTDVPIYFERIYITYPYCSAEHSIK